MTKPSTLAALLASLLLCGGVATADVKVKPDWATPDQLDKALDYAKKHNKPVALLYMLECDS